MKRRSWLSSVSYPLASLAAAALLVGLWQFLVRWRHVRRIILPAPSDIWHELSDDPRLFWDAARITLGHALAGLLIAAAIGLVMAAIFVQSHIAERVLSPIATGLQAVPVIAIAPALVLWFGFGTTPKVITAAFVCVFPFLFNGIAGMRAIDTGAQDVFRSLGASRREVLLRLRVPSSLPYVFAALRTSVGLAVIGATIAEWTGSQVGLGAVLIKSRQGSQTAVVWACVVVLSMMVIGLTLLAKLLEKTCLRHQRAESTS